MYQAVFARSGNKWDNFYLESLGVKIKEVTFEELFGMEKSETKNFVKKDTISKLCSLNLNNKQELLYVIDTEENDDIRDFCDKIYNVIYKHPGIESVVDDLGKELFKLLNISRIKGLTVCGPVELNMVMCGETISAKPDICIESRDNKILLVVQEDKNFNVSEVSSPEGQLFAEMVAAFNNNFNCLKSQIIYGITLLGTYPTFYKVSFDYNILESIVNGYKRPNEVVVTMYKYVLGTKSNNFIIESNENMEKTFSAFEAIRLLLINQNLF